MFYKTRSTFKTYRFGEESRKSHQKADKAYNKYQIHLLNVVLNLQDTILF